MGELIETCCGYIKGDVMYISSSERKIINNIHKWAAEHPDEVKILAEPETNLGSIYATVPINYLNIRPKKKRQMTDEQRLRQADIARKAREKLYQNNRKNK